MVGEEEFFAFCLNFIRWEIVFSFFKHSNGGINVNAHLLQGTLFLFHGPQE